MVPGAEKVKVRLRSELWLSLRLGLPAEFEPLEA
jgi:hypothetical protein